MTDRPDIDAKAFAFSDFEQEIAATRRILESVPEEKLDWKPHEKSHSLRELATHLANLPLLQTAMLEGDSFDIAGPQPPRAQPTTTAELVALFDGNVARLRAAFAEVDLASLRQMWTLRRADNVLFTLPKAHVLRTMGISHVAHHRGQLSVYLRLLGVPVPGLYGPSADERLPA